MITSAARGEGALVRATAMLATPAFAWSVVAIGAALRVAQYASGRSLWLDESYLALNLIDRPFSALFGGLDYNQGAPAGFVLSERLAVDAFGSSEEALRLVPLLAGIASLPLFLAVARRVLSPAAAGAALLLFAVLDGPIYYSAEVKQYSVDMCVALAIVAAGLAVLERALTRKDVLGLAALGAVAVWLSHGGLLVLAGVGTTLLALAVLARDGHRLRQLCVVVGAWAASGAAVYAVNVRRLANEGTGVYINLPIAPTSGAELADLVRGFSAFLTEESALRLPLPLAAAAAGLAILGTVSLARDRFERLLLLAAPVGVVAIASAAGRYPWGGRFTLFLLPIVPILVVEGARTVGRRRIVAAPVLAAALLVLVALPSVAAAARHVVDPRTKEEIEPALVTLGRSFAPGDSLYLNRHAQFAVSYYARIRHTAGNPPPFPAVLPQLPSQGGRVSALRSLPPRLVVATDEMSQRDVPRGARVWVLLSHYGETQQQLLAALDRSGRRLVTETHPGVVLVLYDLRPPS